MKLKKMEFFHRNGKKVVIKDIPFVSKDNEFYLNWDIERLIDIINDCKTPLDVYSLQDELTK